MAYAVEILDVKGQSALVQYSLDNIPHRSYVDVADITKDGKVEAGRLADAPYGINWVQALDLDGEQLKRDIALGLTERGIWTFSDLQTHDRTIIRLATNLLGKAIWKAAKKACPQ